MTIRFVEALLSLDSSGILNTRLKNIIESGAAAEGWTIEEIAIQSATNADFAFSLKKV